MAASEVRAKRLPGTARIIALAAAVLIGASGSLDQGHTAHAADAPLPPASAAAVAAERAPTFEDLLEIAFRGRLITSEDHPLIQQLLGA